MERPRFSIIIPAFNSENYIRKALDSVDEQRFKNYELIVVCDSCHDRTVSIAKRYTDLVYEVEFGNDGPTRNYGIEHANGEYILFLDDDDWFLHEYVLHLLDYMLDQDDNPPDILAFGFIWKHVGYCRNLIDNMYIATWNKCWRREAIGETRFSNKHMASDEDFHNAMMKKDLKIICWDMPMYYYNFLREGSQTYLKKLRETDAEKGV